MVRTGERVERPNAVIMEEDVKISVKDNQACENLLSAVFPNLQVWETRLFRKPENLVKYYGKNKGGFYEEIEMVKAAINIHVIYILETQKTEKSIAWIQAIYTNGGEDSKGRMSRHGIDSALRLFKRDTNLTVRNWIPAIKTSDEEIAVLHKRVFEIAG